MADTSPAAPAATPASTTSTAGQTAVNDVLKTLPNQEPAATTEVEVEDTGADLSPEEIKKAEQTIAKKLHKLKVGGKEVEVDETELLKRAQMGYSADEKWQEASKMRKQMEGFISLLQKDPAQALEQLGFNVDELAENRIKHRIEEMKKSPEQLEREKIQKELETLKADREREKEEARQSELTRLQDQFAVEIENDITSALDNNTYGLPKSPYIVKRIADTMILAMQNGYKDVKSKDVLPIVQEEIKRELHEMYQLSPDEVFEQLVGKDRLTKYRRSKIKKTKPATGSSEVRPTGTSEIQQLREEERNKQPKVKMKDFFKQLGSQPKSNK